MRQDQRMISLDGLRGLAASAVVYSHIEFFYPTGNPWLTMNIGDPAVAIFFSLSGFLMAVLYGGKSFQPADYLVHRFARIYPVYLVAVLWVALLSIAFKGSYIHPIDGPVQVLRHVLMLGSTGVFWSIPPEIQFYLFFLLLWLWFLDPRKYQAVAVVSVAYLVFASLAGFPGPGILLTSKLPYFLFGAMAGRLYTLYPARPAGLATGVMTLLLLPAFFLTARYQSSESFWGIASAFSGSVIVYLAACGHPLSARVLGSPPLVFAGRISFSLYLFHLPVLFLVTHFLGESGPREAVVVLGIALAYLFAWASYTVIEDPSRRLLVGLWKSRRDRKLVAAE
jgi:peptidoglycan/LPS O-acetylase OafA/YrhL